MMASGTPMLPQLLNIIGGTNVRGSPHRSRAQGIAASPDSRTIPAAATTSQPFATRSKSRDDSAMKMSTGIRMSMFALFTPLMSGFAFRAYRKPISATPNTGRMIVRMRETMFTAGPGALQDVLAQILVLDDA